MYNYKNKLTIYKIRKSRYTSGYNNMMQAYLCLILFWYRALRVNENSTVII